MKLYILTTFLILFSYSPIFAQYQYELFGISQGLSQASNACLRKDSIGYLWISSSDGLNRFDGKKFKNYYYNPQDSTSLFGNDINNFIEFKKGCLYVGTKKGLCYYDHILDKFKRIEIEGLPRNTEFDTYPISKLKDTLLILDNANGLYKFCVNTNKLISIDTNIKLPTQNLGFNAISVCKNILFYATKNGIIKYDILKKTKFFLDFDSLYFKKLLVNRIFVVSALDEQNIALGTNNGITFINIKNFAITKHVRMPNHNLSEVYAIGKDLDNSIWIGSNDKTIYVLDNNKFSAIKTASRVSADNALKDVSSFLFTDQNIFFNEDGNGIGILRRNKSFAKSYNANNTENFSYTDPSVYCFAEDKNGEVWIGKRKDGISIFNISTKKFLNFKSICKNDLPSNSVKSILINKEDVYIGTQFGICRFDKSKHLLVNLKYPTYKDNSEARYINHIIKLKNGNIIVGTRDGIYRINRQNDELQLLTSFNSYGYYLFENKKNQIVTTNVNLNLTVYNWQSNRLILEQSYLPKFCIRGIWQDPITNNYWLACLEGILHTDSRFNILQHFNTQNGLKGSTFYGMIPDNDNNIWCSSNKGIVTINLKTLRPYYYFKEDDLSSIEYNGKGFLKHSSDLLFFGGEGGMDVIKPNGIITSSEVKYGLKVENLFINEKEASDLKKIELSDGKLTLRNSENQLAIQLNLVNCETSFKPQICYKIAGLQDHWTIINVGDWIRMNKVEPGFYTFIYKIDNLLGAKEYTLVVQINPAWYQTLLFKILLATLIAGGLYILYSFRIKQLKKVLAVRQKISQNLHDDIGSTLSAINMYTQVAKLQSQSNDFITSIEENTQDALGKLDDIIWSTNPKNDKVKNLIERMDGFARPLLQAKNIQFNFTHSSTINEQKIGEATRQNLFVIFKEAINNVVKYAACTSCIVTLDEKNKNICCTITDNGKGFDVTKPSERNGILNMQLRAKEMKGSFKIESTPAIGTTIKVQLPI